MVFQTHVKSQLCRAYILSVSARSGINPPIKLPMINVFSLRDKKGRSVNKRLRISLNGTGSSIRLMAQMHFYS